MNTLRYRIPRVENLRANDYDEQRFREVKQERCGICFDRWPSSMMLVNDGKRRCPDCYDTRDEAAKMDIRQYDNYQVATKQTKPQVSQGKLLETPIPFIRRMEDVNGVKIWAGSPLVVTPDVAGVQLTLIGGNFLTGDTFSFGAGIDNIALYPSINVAGTQWTLKLLCLGAVDGLTYLTFNSHTYQKILMAVSA